MNIISFISIVTAILYVALIVRVKSTKGLDLLNVFTILVCACLGLWSFCDAFFVVSQSKQEAWFWHHLSAICFSLYGGVTSYYFLIMSGFYKKLNTICRQIIYWSLPALLMLHNVFANSTSLAQDIYQGDSGLGWTIKINFSSLMTILYFLYLFVYLGGAFGYLLMWAHKEKDREEKILAYGFIILNVICVSICVINYIFIPCTTSFPPIIAIGSLTFLAGYWFILREYDLLHVELALNPKIIFDSCLDAMIITNIKLVVLYGNQEAEKLLGVNCAKQISLSDYLTEDSVNTLSEFVKTKSCRLQNIDLHMQNGTKLLCTISRSNTYSKKVPIIIISLHDITQLKEMQEKLEYMAHYDELTGLPNRRVLAQYQKKLEIRYYEEHKDFQLLFLDLDNFKQINDTFGHQLGDKVIQSVGFAIKTVLDDDDVAVRLSGDEFVVIHPLNENEKKTKIRDKLVECITNIKLKELPDDFKISTSIGYSCFSETRNMKHLMKEADQYMYENKKIKKFT